jgi:hypothetical protein
LLSLHFPVKSAAGISKYPEPPVTSPKKEVLENTAIVSF